MNQNRVRGRIRREIDGRHYKFEMRQNGLWIKSRRKDWKYLSFQQLVDLGDGQFQLPMAIETIRVARPMPDRSPEASTGPEKTGPSEASGTHSQADFLDTAGTDGCKTSTPGTGSTQEAGKPIGGEAPEATIVELLAKSGPGCVLLEAVGLGAAIPATSEGDEDPF